MKIGFLITARLKSTRLPKKVILPVCGREIIRWMIDRLKLSKRLSRIILCTSTNEQDDLLEQIARQEKIDCFRGSEDDVIKRLYDASVQFNLDYALNITADTPLVSIEYIEKIIDVYNEQKADLIRTLDLPHGFYAFGLKIDAMKRVCEIKKSDDTEVWGKYFTNTGLFRVLDIPTPEELKRPAYRLTIDYPEDYEFLKILFENMGKDTYRKSVKEIIGFLDENPEIVKINARCAEWFRKNLLTRDKLVV